MKKLYIQPITECVNVRLKGSVLDDTLPMGNASEYATTMWGNENNAWDDEDDNAAFAPSTNNLWDE